jgi:hypothetical protein
MLVRMLIKGRLCRIVFLLLLWGGWIGVQAGPLIKWHKPHALGSHQPGGLSSHQSRGHAATDESYLQVTGAPRVDYEEHALNAPLGSISKPLVSAPPSYSSFVERLELTSEAEGETGGELSEASSAAAAAPSQVDAAPSGAGPVRFSASESVQAGPGRRSDLAGTSQAPVSVDVAQAQIFTRYEPDGGELSKLLMFFPAVETTTEGLGGYNVLTPVDRFDYFTPPSQNLPKSSARYRTVPK